MLKTLESQVNFSDLAIQPVLKKKVHGLQRQCYRKSKETQVIDFFIKCWCIFDKIHKISMILFNCCFF